MRSKGELANGMILQQRFNNILVNLLPFTEDSKNLKSYYAATNCHFEIEEDLSSAFTYSFVSPKYNV